MFRLRWWIKPGITLVDDWSLQEWSSGTRESAGVAADAAAAREEAASAAQTREKIWNTNNKNAQTCHRSTFRTMTYRSAGVIWVRTGSRSSETGIPVPELGDWEVGVADARWAMWPEGHYPKTNGWRHSDHRAHRSYLTEESLRSTPSSHWPWAEKNCWIGWGPPHPRWNYDWGRWAGAGWRRRGSVVEEVCFGRRGRSCCGTDYRKGAPVEK